LVGVLVVLVGVLELVVVATNPRVGSDVVYDKLRSCKFVVYDNLRSCTCSVVVV